MVTMAVNLDVRSPWWHWYWDCTGDLRNDCRLYMSVWHLDWIKINLSQQPNHTVEARHGCKKSSFPRTRKAWGSHCVCHSSGKGSSVPNQCRCYTKIQGASLNRKSSEMSSHWSGHCGPLLRVCVRVCVCLWAHAHTLTTLLDVFPFAFTSLEAILWI
jgi:hypothetical protein